MLSLAACAHQPSQLQPDTRLTAVEVTTEIALAGTSDDSTTGTAVDDSGDQGMMADNTADAGAADDAVGDDTAATSDIAAVLQQEDPDPEHTNLDHMQVVIEAETADPVSVIAQDTSDNTMMEAEPAAEADDIWQRLRAGFEFAESEHKRTRIERDWYAGHQAYLDRTIERAAPYLYMIVEEVEERGIPTEIALLPIVESAFQPFAYSHGRAAGIWQFIPSTGRIYGLKQNWWYDGRRDIEASTRAALRYLSQLQQAFDGDWLLALAAYNSGQGTVQKAIRSNKRRGRPTDFWSLRLPRETRAYVPKLLALRAIFNNPEQYGITLKPVPNRPYLAKVPTESQIDLALAADMAGISLEELYRLNPAFNRWATSPDGPHHLLVPVKSAERFTTELASLPASKRIKWKRHKIRDGETLGHIANQYHTTVAVLRSVNNIRGHMIRAGNNLIIPVATKQLSNYSLSAAQRSRAIRNTPQKGRKINYTVRRGDNLWDISRKYHVSVRQLAKWNGMAPRDVLREGQRLVIWWQPGKTATVAGPVNFSAVTGNDTLQRIHYIVRRGDSLARISQRFNVKISQLRSWNTLPKGKYLQPGQKLTLFVDVTRQADNS